MASTGNTSKVAGRADPAAFLQTIPNVCPATAGNLLGLGINQPHNLIGLDGDQLFGELCRLDGLRHDPCIRDVFAARDAARAKPDSSAP